VQSNANFSTQLKVRNIQLTARSGGAIIVENSRTSRGVAVKLLVIEDERSVINALAQGLADAGHGVEFCHDGRQGLARAKASCFDLILLDVMLPELDGWSVLAELRRTNCTPVLMLTARDAIEDRVRGLRGGADDYVAKPFALPELLARCEAILRRGRPEELTELEVADLRLDCREGRVERAGRRVALSPKEYALLRLLMRHQAEVLPRAMIARAVWGIEFDTETNTVDVVIRRLRAKIDEGYSPKLIHTVRGVGYSLAVREQ
jgi:two-component system copper resistance phosphate regulon response regulator CusR